MKNKITDLNNHLFVQLERLNDEELKGEHLKQEIDRSKAMANIATQIVNSQKTTLDAMKLVASGKVSAPLISKMIGQESE